MCFQLLLADPQASWNSREMASSAGNGFSPHLPGDATSLSEGHFSEFFSLRLSESPALGARLVNW
jgi:hypothetical protein